LLLIKWLFQTRSKFFKGFFQAGKYGIAPLFMKDKSYDPAAFLVVLGNLRIFAAAM
jgi:hypothetical protein